MSNKTDNMAMKLIIETVKVKFPRVPIISTEEFWQFMKEGSPSPKLVLLDVREEKEFKVSHICSARHVDPSTKDMNSLMKTICETGKSSEDSVQVVCYCSVGYRSSALAQELLSEIRKPAYEEIKSRIRIYNLEGSIFKWANEGKDLEDNCGRKTTVVHPYSSLWGKLLNAELRCSEPSEPDENREEDQKNSAKESSKM